MSLQETKAFRVFDGTQYVYSHEASTTKCTMEFAIFIPDSVKDTKASVLFYLSGLTCTWENVTSKACAQKYASEQGIILVCPDTSPRGDDVPDHDGYDFGKGAGFYVNATEAPWADHYHMYDYVTQELYGLVAENFSVDMDRVGITGHSMGGHGALTIAFKNPDLFKSVSAFAPITSPMNCPWGHKALGGYIGEDQTVWADYDACALLVSKGWGSDILVDQGMADNFLEEQLKPELLEAACKEAGVSLTLRRQDGHDHSYYFIASFIEDHVKWHKERLG